MPGVLRARHRGAFSWPEPFAKIPACATDLDNPDSLDHSAGLPRGHPSFRAAYAVGRLDRAWSYHSHHW